MAAKETTTSYRWGDGIITRIDVRAQSDGRAVAYLYADEREEARPQRQEIRAAIRLKGWGTLSDHREGKFALRVSGLKDGNELLTMLTSAGFVGAPVSVDKQIDQPAQGKNPLGRIKNDTLRASAIGYTAGDALYYMGGVKDPMGARGQQRKLMAASFAAGDTALAIFGGRDDARQFKSLLGKLKSHMESSGIEIPKNAAIHVETSTSDDDLLSGAKQFLHTHINSLKMLAEVVGGFFAFRGGVKGKSKLDMAGGAVVMAGWAGALVVPEKKRDPDQVFDAGPIANFASYVQEKPTRLAGWAGLLFNAMTVGGAYRDRRSAKGAYDLAAVTTMFGANTLYSMSNKTVGGDIRAQEMVSDVYTVAAQILNKQPDNVRESAIESTAKFLGERTEIKDTHSQIVARLHEEMAIQRQNPWFETRGLAPYKPVPHKPRVHMPGMEQTPAMQVQADGLQHTGPVTELGENATPYSIAARS